MTNPEMGPREPDLEIPQLESQQNGARVEHERREPIDTMDSPAFQKKTVEYVENYLNKDRIAALRESTGIGSDDEAWKKYLEDYGEDGGLDSLMKIDKVEALRALTGIDLDKAWEIRKELESEYPEEVLDSISGIDSDIAWELRDIFLKEGNVEVARTLMGMDSSEAWKMREQIIKNLPPKQNSTHEYPNRDYMQARSSILEGLAGLDSDKAWKLRESFLKDEDLPNKIKDPFLYGQLRSSLRGLDSDRAWEMRDRLLKKVIAEGEGDDHVFELYLLSDLIGLDSDRAWKMREEWIEKDYHGQEGKFAKMEVLESLAGVDSERAWKLREEILATGHTETYGALAYSLSGLDSPRAWKMREKILGDIPILNKETEILRGIYGGIKMVAARKVRHDQIEQAEKK